MNNKCIHELRWEGCAQPACQHAGREIAEALSAFSGAQQAYLKANNEREELQYRYDQLQEKLSNAHEYIEELETERKGLKEMIRDAKARFDEVRADCGRLLDQIKGHHLTEMIGNRTMTPEEYGVWWDAIYAEWQSYGSAMLCSDGGIFFADWLDSMHEEYWNG